MTLEVVVTNIILARALVRWALAKTRLDSDPETGLSIQQFEHTWTITRRLGDGRWLQVFPITFGRARLAMGPADQMTYDDVW